MEVAQRTDDPTDLRSELDRKAWECLERLVRHEQQGKIGTEGLGIGIRAVWETVSGLASQPISELATQLHKECHVAPTPVTRLFRHIESGAPAVAVRWVPGSTLVKVLKVGGEARVFNSEDEVTAKARFFRLCESLTTQFEEWT